MAKILLVEDNELNRDMLSRRLQRKGYEVIIAVDGGEGVAMAHSHAPDLILMDMSLPVLDGWEATRKLKAAPGDRGHSRNCADCPRHGHRSAEKATLGVQAATTTILSRSSFRVFSARSRPMLSGARPPQA